jgi:hypothetical protein
LLGSLARIAPDGTANRPATAAGSTGPRTSAIFAQAQHVFTFVFVLFVVFLAISLGVRFWLASRQSAM